MLFWHMAFPFMLKGEAFKNLVIFFKQNHSTDQMLTPQLIYHLDMLEGEILEAQIITDVTSNLKITHLYPLNSGFWTKKYRWSSQISRSWPCRLIGNFQMDHELVDLPGQPKQKYNAVTVAAGENGSDKINLTSYKVIWQELWAGALEQSADVKLNADGGGVKPKPWW